MNTFDLISKKIIGIENDTFLFANIHKINFFIFLQKDYSSKNKFIFLKETIENIFYTDDIREKFLDYFKKIQKTYNAFSRLAFLYKYKKAKIMIHTDLIMNEIEENEKYVFCLLQNNCKYLFKIHELIKIIENSVANSCHFFSNPISIKNPYTNIVLNKSTLYNIYFFMRTKTILHSEILYYFFKTNFHLYNFAIKYQHLLRNFSLKSYFTNSSQYVIVDNIECMIDNYNLSIHRREKQIIIDRTFPKDLLIGIMKPYLDLFLKSQYSSLIWIRVLCKNLLKEKLIAFNKFNPQFGRKIYIKDINLLNQTNIRFQYNTKHIAFNENENEKDINEFMKSHATKLSEELNEQYDNETDDDVDNSNNDNNNNNNDNNDNDIVDNDDNDDNDDEIPQYVQDDDSIS